MEYGISQKEKYELHATVILWITKLSNAYGSTVACGAAATTSWSLRWAASALGADGPASWDERFERRYDELICT